MQSALRTSNIRITDWGQQYHHYVQLLDDDLLLSLHRNQEEINRLLEPLTEAQASYAYAPGKWSIKEVLGHIVDAERVMSYRAMSLARGEKQSLPGFDENEYVRQAHFSRRSMRSLLDEFNHLRNANIVLFESFDETALARKGIANGIEVSVLALCAIVAGHAIHHVHVLKEKYLPFL
ncbi:putative damage-inducible protein DinB [Thermonema lapsum]|uniref:Putative damage-inducible protein DinB n=1 Tax=Thermonema lapsum TaxID=28195 RepID=A0A846MMB1_9BACT|nr:DinB family protein [Thermonema lapsum]NIK72609.1 putative damage-inducible protein DinB [Thermonema lapsum]